MKTEANKPLINEEEKFVKDTNFSINYHSHPTKDFMPKVKNHLLLNQNSDEDIDTDFP